MPKDWAEIIAAVTTPLGLAALSILAIGTLAAILFKSQKPATRIAAFAIAVVASLVLVTIAYR